MKVYLLYVLLANEMMSGSPLDLYREHYVEKDFTRSPVFDLIHKEYAVESAIYPGSFAHITPSFFFPTITFIDLDEQAREFFEYPGLIDFINSQKIYDENLNLKFHYCDYRQPIKEETSIYDLLISQYAGFISQDCKRYLKIGGILLVNISHGDASMAWVDDNYELMAVILKRGIKYSLKDNDLVNYFAPKKDIRITREYIKKIKRGINYKKKGSSYIFRRVS